MSDDSNEPKKLKSVTPIIDDNPHFERDFRNQSTQDDPLRHNGLGRPTKYFPEYAQMLIDHMAIGYTYETFASTVTVSVKTLYNWELQHEEFLLAKEIGMAKGQYFWEGLGIMGASGNIPSFNTSVWIFMMKNRFGWRDNPEDNKDAKQMDWSQKLSVAMSEFDKAVAEGKFPMEMPAQPTPENGSTTSAQFKAKAKKRRPDNDPRQAGKKAKRDRDAMIKEAQKKDE